MFVPINDILYFIYLPIYRGTFRYRRKESGGPGFQKGSFK